MIDLVGTWRLVWTTAHTPEGDALPPPYGPTPTGIVTFTESGRMVAALCDTRDTVPDGTEREYLSYCGRYTFDGTHLVTRVDGASDPARIGTDQVRQVDQQDGYLVLRPPVDTATGRDRQRVLAWEKISDA